MNTRFRPAQPTAPVVPRAQRGVVLIEALIAILLFAVGVLGLVALQAQSVSFASDARYRTDASFLAEQLIGEIWGNRNNVAAYAWAGSGSAPAPLAAWATQVRQTLPGAAGNPPRIEFDAATNRVTVTLFWRPPHATAPHSHVAIAYVNG